MAGDERPGRSLAIDGFFSEAELFLLTQSLIVMKGHHTSLQTAVNDIIHSSGSELTAEDMHLDKIDELIQVFSSAAPSDPKQKMAPKRIK